MQIRRNFLEQQASAMFRGMSSALALVLLSAVSACDNPEPTVGIWAQKDREGEAATIDRPDLLQSDSQGTQPETSPSNTAVPERWVGFQPGDAEIKPEKRQKAVMAAIATIDEVTMSSASLPLAREAEEDTVSVLASRKRSAASNDAVLTSQASDRKIVEALPAPLQPALARSSKPSLALPGPLVGEMPPRLARNQIGSANVADAGGKQRSIDVAEEPGDDKPPSPFTIVKASKGERVSPLESRTRGFCEVNGGHRGCASLAFTGSSPQRQNMPKNLNDRLDLKETSVSMPAGPAQTSTAVTGHRAITVLEEADKSDWRLSALPKNDATKLGPDRGGLQQKPDKAPHAPQEKVSAEKTSLPPNPMATALAAAALPARSFEGTLVNDTLSQLEKTADKTGAKRFDRTLDPRVDMAQIATNGRTAYMAQLSSELSQSRLAVRQGTNIIGEIQVDMIEGRMAVHVGQVLELFEPRLDQMLYADLRNSRAAGEFVTLERLAANGIPLTYDAVYDELVLSPDAG